MRKPKAGDTVIIVHDESGHYVPIGTEKVLYPISQCPFYYKERSLLGPDAFLVESPDTNSGYVCLGLEDVKLKAEPSS